MVDYQDLVPFIKKWEGGLTGDPRDTSAAANPAPCGNDPRYNRPYHTNKGVTWATYRSTIPGANCAEFLEMPDAVFGQIWKKHYWDKVGGNYYSNQAVANAYASWAWGSGVAGANRQMEKFLMERYGYSLTQVSQLQQRIIILNQLSADDMKGLFDNLVDFRLKFFQSLPNWNVYGNGWTRRLNAWKVHNYKYIFMNEDYTKYILAGLAVLLLSLSVYYFVILK
jgi:lysozyme family protein